MTKPRLASVWDAIEDTPAQAENMKLRSALMMALKHHIARERLSQSEAARLLAKRDGDETVQPPIPSCPIPALTPPRPPL